MPEVLPRLEENAETQASPQGEDHPLRPVQEGVQRAVPIRKPQENQTPKECPLLQLPPLRKKILPKKLTQETHRERPFEQI